MILPGSITHHARLGKRILPHIRWEIHPSSGKKEWIMTHYYLGSKSNYIWDSHQFRVWLHTLKD